MPGYGSGYKGIRFEVFQSQFVEAVIFLFFVFNFGYAAVYLKRYPTGLRDVIIMVVVMS